MRSFIFYYLLCFVSTLSHRRKTRRINLWHRHKAAGKKRLHQSSLSFFTTYKSLSQKGDYKQAIDAGTQAAYLYYRENYYQEAFDLCRQMNQFILTEEQKLQKSLYEQRFQVTKERLEMYIKLKNAAQAQVQLNTLDNLPAKRAMRSYRTIYYIPKQVIIIRSGKTSRGMLLSRNWSTSIRRKKNTRRWTIATGTWSLSLVRQTTPHWWNVPTTNTSYGRIP